MIHRAPFGSFERFIAVLIENCAGNFPLWLAPQQVSILPISDKFVPYAEEVLALLKQKNIRAAIDYRSEKIGRKIRDAAVEKVPYHLIIGEKEVTNNTLSVRRHTQGDKGSLTQTAFLEMFETELND